MTTAPWWRPRWRRIALLTLLVWALAVLVAVTSVRDDLTLGRRALEDARGALNEGDLTQAHASLGASTYLLGRADRRLSAWYVRLAGAVPLAGRTLDTARTLADGAHRVAREGHGVTDALLVARNDSSATDDGRLPVGVIAALDEPLAALASAVADAADAVHDSPSRFVLGAVADARATFLDLAAPLVPDLAASADLVAHLPRLLGEGGTATYLFGVSNPAEQRGTGGYVGSYTRLELRDGRLAFGDFRETSGLARPRAVTGVDPSVVARYSPFGVPTSWQNVNFTPDFPVAASNLEGLWRASFDEELDGVIVVDPEAFAQLLALTGPVTTPTGTTVDADSAAAYLANGAFVDIEDNEERKLVLGAIAAQTLQAFLGQMDLGDVVPAARAFGELLSARHIQVWFADDGAEQALSSLDLSGSLRAPNVGELLAVTVNNGSATKIDFYLDRTIHHHVELLGGGRAAAELTVELELDAPTEGLPTRVIGPVRPELEAGEALHWLSAYCAPGCAMTATPRSLPTSLPTGDPGVELGMTVHSVWVTHPSHESVARSWAWRAPAAWRWEGDEMVYRLHYRHQPTLGTTTLDVTIAVPPDTVVADAPPGAEVGDGAVRVTADVTEDLDLEVRFRPV